MQEFIIESKDAGQRFDKYLKKRLPGAATSLIYKQLRKKNITLNQKKAQGNEILQVGDSIRCFFSDETFQLFQNGAEISNGNKASFDVKEYESAFRSLKGIQIIYENEDILILHKPVGILSQKSVPNDITANEWLIGYLLHEGCISEKSLSLFKPSVCNRLDRNTSGLLLCGKSLPGSQALSECLKKRYLQKYYLTICHGNMKQGDTVEGYLKKNEKNNTVSIRLENDDQGSEGYIKTKYDPIYSNQEYTFLKVELITGKTHQIRAHLSCVGHPLLGDAKYAPEHVFSEDKGRFHQSYQLLHAYQVVFPNEDTLKLMEERYRKALIPLCNMHFESKLPKNFQKILSEIFPEAKDMTSLSI